MTNVLNRSLSNFAIYCNLADVNYTDQTM